ncbi:hypothetical protein [Acrocarpospora catenulata]|uniref:hypothetical protein n=1 Tax=Acrocarpospora catenulata TaxID=2836182 RepID=UPI001BDA7AD0|nr:hypothetical protein [Acrocarpospora catenulata]
MERLAAQAEARFADDQAMSQYYNTALAGGKWKNWQLQPHIGYGDIARYGPNAPWQQPELNNVALPDEIFPAVRRITLPAVAEMGVAIDGSDAWWPNSAAAAVLPEFSPYQSQPEQYIEVFNRGGVAFDYQIKPSVPWLRADPAKGRLDKQVRSTLRVDWSRAPKGTTSVPITVTGPGGAGVVVQAVVRKPDGPVKGFVEANGYVSIDDGPPQVVDVIAATGSDDTRMNRQWERNTSDNVNRTVTTHTITTPGAHTLKFWMVDPTVIVQKLVVDTGGVLPSYLGPPQSKQV